MIEADHIFDGVPTLVDTESKVQYFSAKSSILGG